MGVLRGRFTFFLHSGLEALPQSAVSALVPFVLIHYAIPAKSGRERRAVKRALRLVN